MAPKLELAQTIQLVLLAVLQSLEKPVAIGGLCCDPGVRRRVTGTPAGNEIDVSIVPGNFHKIVQPFPGNVRTGQINRMISFSHVKSTAVHRHRFDDRCNKEIRIGIPIAMSIGRKIIRKEKVTYLEELRDGFAMVSGYTGRKILGSLDSARCRFDRETRKRNGSARPAGISIENLVVDNHALRGIGS